MMKITFSQGSPRSKNLNVSVKDFTKTLNSFNLEEQNSNEIEDPRNNTIGIIDCTKHAKNHEEKLEFSKTLQDRTHSLHNLTQNFCANKSSGQSYYIPA
jgi:hypothetical protein